MSPIIDQPISPGISPIIKKPLDPSLKLWITGRESRRIDNVSIISDLSEYKNNGTIFGARWTANGFGGQTLRFDGVDDYVDCGKSIYTMGIRRVATFEAWVNIAVLAGTNHYILSDWSGVLGMALLIFDGGKIAYFFVYPNNHRITLNYSFSANTWYHIAGVMNSANMFLYLNGEQKGTAVLGEDVGSSPQTFKVGSRGARAAGQYLNGKIDEARIYNRALNSAEVMERYNETKGMFGY